MNGAITTDIINEPWISVRGEGAQEQNPQFSGSAQSYFYRPRFTNLAGTINTAGYVSTAPYFLRVYENPGFQLDQDDKKRYLNNWVTRISMISQPLVSIMLGFTNLGDNWDSYGAVEISLSTILNAIGFYMQIIDLHPNSPLPFVAPVPDGSIHFEWSTCSSELRHIIPKKGSVCHVYKIIDRRSGELKEFNNSIYGMNEMVRVFSKWIEGNY